MHRRQDFLSLVVIAAAVVTPAWGQIGVPAAGPASVQTAASIPDFSGIWGHPYLPGFEPPLSGPGPVMNKTQPAPVTPSWYGDSVGHYEGDTLVIDTVGVKADRPFAMVDMYGTPYT